jgi:hypothetical protein
MLTGCTVPGWSCAVENTWDLGTVGGVSSDVVIVPQDVEEKDFSQLKRCASIEVRTSFSHRRMLEAESLFTRVLRLCLRSGGHGSYVDEICRHRPKWVSDRTVEDIVKEMGAELDNSTQ